MPYAVEPPDPAADLGTLETELCLADLEAIETRIERTRKAAVADRSKAPVAAAMEAALVPLGEGVPLYRAGLGADTLAPLGDLFLLTHKPVLYVVNIGEGDLGREADVEAALRKTAGNAAEVVAVCVALEAEAAHVADPAERVELLESFGIAEPALPRVAHAAYRALGKLSFLTTGPKESRAWTVRAGDTVRRAAGVIHSDLERGFIRAEVATFDDVVAAGGWDEAKKENKVRLEGKDYVVADGDVVVVRFNV